MAGRIQIYAFDIFGEILQNMLKISLGTRLFFCTEMVEKQLEFDLKERKFNINYLIRNFKGNFHLKLFSRPAAEFGH